MRIFPKNWSVCEVDTVCAEIVDCVNKTAPVVAGPTEYKMIRTTNVRNGRIDLNDARFVDEATFIKWTRRVRPRRNDIVLTREAPLGEIGLLRSDEKVFLGQRTMLYRADPKKLDQNFLYYSMIGPYVQAQITGQGNGSTVEHLRVPDAEKLKIPLAPLSDQRKIAAILSAYDDLIENNQRRIVLLEKMAEEIYREWFVRLRFPGYEQAKFEKGVPVGWEITTSFDVLHVLSGGTPKTDIPEYWNGDIPFFTPRDASDAFYVQTTEKYITDKGLKACNSHLYSKNTIFITARGTVGKVALAYKNMAMNQSCYALKSKREDEAYFYFLAVKNSITYVKGISKSGVFDNIIIDTFKNIPMLMPPKQLVDSFNILACPIFDQIGKLLESQSLLASTREKLLVRLISGKLAVESLDIHFPPSMQQAA